MSKSSPSRFRKWFLPGLIGYNFGICLTILLFGSVFLNRSVADLRTAYDATAVALSGIDTPPPNQYDPFFEEVENLIQINPEGAILLLEPELQAFTNDLDRASGYSYLAEANLLLGNHEKAVEHYEQVLSLLPPMLDEGTGVRAKGRIYTYLIFASIGVEDYTAAQLYYDEMKSEFVPNLNDMQNIPELAESYWSLISVASQLVDYSEAESYYTKMRTHLDPLLDILTNSEDIGETYTYLVEAATLMWDTDNIEKYNQELVDKLSPIRGGFINTEEKAILNEYLGNSEFALGHYQLSAVYYKELVENERTARNVYRLATTYELGGDLGCAYFWYQELIALEQLEEIAVYTDIAESAAARLKEVCTDCGVPDCP